MPNLAALSPLRAGSTALGIAATVTRAPASTLDTLDVEWEVPPDINSPDETATERGIRWTRRGTALPAVGDYALLLVDSQGDAFAVIW